MESLLASFLYANLDWINVKKVDNKRIKLKVLERGLKVESKCCSEKGKCQLLAIMFGFLCIFGYLHFFMGVKLSMLYLPIRYGGVDDFTTYANAKNIYETGWTFNNTRLGAPFDTCFLDFPPYFLDNIGNLLTKFFLNFTSDYILALNINYYSIPFISFLTAYFVMMEVKLSFVNSWCGALLFSLLPYYFMRGVLHFVLSEIYFIPLSILLCFWCYEGKILSGDLSKPYHNKYNLFAILFCLLIANNGIGYYPAFTCFFLVLTGIIKYSEDKSWKAVIPSITVIMSICLFFCINFIPAFIYHVNEGKNYDVAKRVSWEPDIYGLKLSQMLLPQYVPKAKALEKNLQKYFHNAPSSNENNSAYLTFVGSIGFLILLFKLLAVRNKNEQENIRIVFLSKLNIFGVLLATIGGGGAIVAVLITPMLRGYNRISVFIAFISLCAFFMFLEKAEINKNKKICLAVLLTAFSLGMQFHRAHLRYDLFQQEVNSDKQFVQRIEEGVSTGAMIYQLPFHKFPEGGYSNKMKDYYLLIGDLYSKKLRWSYGGIRGRYSSGWHEYIAKLPLEKRLKVLSIIGFEGIYVDSRAYKAEEMTKLDGQLKQILKVQPIISSNKNLLFYNLDNFSKKYKSTFTDEDLKEEKERLLNFPVLLKTTLYGEEYNNNETWRWMSDKAEIIIYNPGKEYCKEMRFTAKSPASEKADLYVDVNGKTNAFDINNAGTLVICEIKIEHGMNIIKLSSNANKVLAPLDHRELYVMLQDINVDMLSGINVDL